MLGKAKRYIEEEEEKHGIVADEIIPMYGDMCASFLYHMRKHVCQRVQRALEYIDRNQIIPGDKKTLVVSGGVACNRYIVGGLEQICNEMGFSCIAPPPPLCTDNGVMIAWAGLEQWAISNHGTYDYDSIHIQPKCSFGEDKKEDLIRAEIKC